MYCTPEVYSHRYGQTDGRTDGQPGSIMSRLSYQAYYSYLDGNTIRQHWCHINHIMFCICI